MIRIRASLVGLALGSFWFAAAFCTPAFGERLHSPWDGHAVALSGVPYTCPAPSAFARTLRAQSYYRDEHNSIIDPAKKEAYEKAAEGPTHLGQWVSEAADAYRMKGSRAAAQCAYALLSAAATADAWSADMPTNQANYVQKWMLSGTAMAYLKVRDSGLGTPAQDKQIQKWFDKLAVRVRTYVSERRKNPNSDAWNNHLYWAGLAVAAAGIACNSKDHFHWGLNAYTIGVEDIQPSGMLPREMARAGMALHYHLYSLGPLVMLAELGAANGMDLYTEHHGALVLLARLCEAGLKDPQIFTRATGVEQNLPAQISGADIGWAVPYMKHFPDEQLSAWIARAPSTRFWQWGGLPPE